MAVAKKTAAKKQTAVKPAPKAAPEATAEEATFGVSDVADLIQVRTGKTVKTRDLRTLLRKMARDGRLDRVIVAGNRARWEFDGPTDPRVEAIVEAFESGELEADKQEKLAALKERKAEQRAAAKAASEDEDEDEDEAGDDELEEE